MSNQVKRNSPNEDRSFSIPEIASMFGLSENLLRQRITGAASPPQYLSIGELAARWRCSRGTVYNRLRAVGAKVLDFAPCNKKGKKVVPQRIVL